MLCSIGGCCLTGTDKKQQAHTPPPMAARIYVVIDEPPSESAKPPMDQSDGKASAEDVESVAKGDKAKPESIAGMKKSGDAAQMDSENSRK